MIRSLILALCLLTALTSCAELGERQRIRRALKDHRASQAEFTHRYAPEIRLFLSLIKNP